MLELGEIQSDSFVEDIEDKDAIIPIARNLEQLGFKLIATGGTCEMLKEQGIMI